MALLKTLSLLLLSLLTLLGLGLVQHSYGETMYQQFLREHVDSSWTGGNNWYCNTVMPRRGMTRPRCKQLHTFINEGIEKIKNICRNPNIQCKNGRMNCHAGFVRVTDCRLTGNPPKKCRYEGKGRSRRVVIACQDNPQLPVRLDS